jgi:hypothetical protein
MESPTAPPPFAPTPPVPQKVALNDSKSAVVPLHDTPHKNASYGALISIIIILAIVVVGAFYSWGKRIEQNTIPAPTIEEAPTYDAAPAQ